MTQSDAGGKTLRGSMLVGTLQGSGLFLEEADNSFENPHLLIRQPRCIGNQIGDQRTKLCNA